MKVCPQCQQEFTADVDYCPSDGTKLRGQREQARDPLIGRALDGRWVIEEKLGEGGMGAVYRGHQKSVSRTVAIKTLRPQLVDSDEFVDRFFREARIAATISHPNSVTILDYGESEDGTLYLAMEFLEGQLLTDRIEEGSSSIRQVLEIGVQVASALTAAHANNIVHRDLKPDNIFLLDVPGGATFVKVLDFGIAKMLDSNTQVTKTGMIFGTPEYMSPEQCRGGKIDGRADLYSLGCIMYELVGGRTPFRGTTPMAVLMAHVNEAAPALVPDGTAAQVPAEIENVIMRLLEKDPEHRFADAAELRHILEALLHALENPNSTISRELVKPVPTREVLGPEVSIGFDATMGLDVTGPGVALETEPRREQVYTDSMATPPRSRASLVILVALLLSVVGAGFLLASVLSNPDGAAVEPAKVANERPPAEVVAKPAIDPGAPLDEAAQTDLGAAAAAVAAKSETVETVEPVPAEPAPKRPRSKTKETAKATTVDTPAQKDPRVARPEPKTEPTPAPSPTPAPAPEPAPKKKPKVVRELEKDINKKAEKARDDAVKGVEKGLDKLMDGLMQ